MPCPPLPSLLVPNTSLPHAACACDQKLGSPRSNCGRQRITSRTVTSVMMTMKISGQELPSHHVSILPAFAARRRCTTAPGEPSQCAAARPYSTSCISFQGPTTFFDSAWKTSEHSAPPAFSPAYLGPRATCFFANVGKLPLLDPQEAQYREEEGREKEEGRKTKLQKDCGSNQEGTARLALSRDLRATDPFFHLH